jgi:hypothetical protein
MFDGSGFSRDAFAPVEHARMTPDSAPLHPGYGASASTCCRRCPPDFVGALSRSKHGRRRAQVVVT